MELATLHFLGFYIIPHKHLLCDPLPFEELSKYSQKYHSGWLEMVESEHLRGSNEQKKTEENQLFPS